MITRGLGFIESGVNPNDAIYAAPKIELPKSYELKEQLRVLTKETKEAAFPVPLRRCSTSIVNRKVVNRASVSNTFTTTVLTRLLTE